jgi:acyl-CoA dehydrogenase
VDFSLTAEQLAIRDSVARLCRASMQSIGWSATAMAASRSSTAPSRRLAGSASPCRGVRWRWSGITEAALLMQAISESGAGFSGIRRAYEHLRVESRRRLWHPEQATLAATAHPRRGEGVLRSYGTRCGAQHGQHQDIRAARGRRYVLRGQKIWISTAQVAAKC